MRASALALLACLALVAPESFGGAQMYEPLSASVQAALSRAVSDRGAPKLAFAHLR